METMIGQQARALRQLCLAPGLGPMGSTEIWDCLAGPEPESDDGVARDAGGRGMRGAPRRASTALMVAMRPSSRLHITGRHGPCSAGPRVHPRPLGSRGASLI